MFSRIVEGGKSKEKYDNFNRNGIVSQGTSSVVEEHGLFGSYVSAGFLPDADVRGLVDSWVVSLAATSATILQTFGKRAAKRIVRSRCLGCLFLFTEFIHIPEQELF